MIEVYLTLMCYRVLLLSLVIKEVVDEVLPRDGDIRRGDLRGVLLGPLVRRPGEESGKEVPYSADEVGYIDGEGQEGQGFQDVSHRRPEDPPRLSVLGPPDTPVTEGGVTSW